LALPAWAQAAEAPKSLWQQILWFVDAGGPVIVILMVISVIALALVMMKLVQFARMGVGNDRFVEPVAQQMRGGDFAGAARALKDEKGPVAAVMRAATAGRGMDGETPMVREEVERIAQAQIEGMERGMASLGLIATASPLLGLLGTVTGLIGAFQQLASAGDRVDPAILASGIWEALLTTAAGLVIAIPVASIHVWLQRTIDGTARRMEDAATQVFTVDLYGAGGLKDEQAAPTKPQPTLRPDRDAPPMGAAPVPAE
jgi:biopolymer transport protein ExbB